jgi:hypothetical protein
MLGKDLLVLHAHANIEKRQAKLDLQHALTLLMSGL